MANRQLKQRWEWGGGGNSVSLAPVIFRDYEKRVLYFVGQLRAEYFL